MDEMKRPELGKLAVGDTVYVWPATSKRKQDAKPVPARVTSVARVWVELESVETFETIHGTRPRRTWRMRLDSQDSGNRMYSQRNDSFITAEQLAYDQRITAAYRVLRKYGIDIVRFGPSDNDAFRVRLADMLTRGA